MGYSFRLFEESDLDGCLRLWAENTEWGEITAEQFRTWYQNTPHGEAIIAVAAAEDGEIVGQTMFTPTLIKVGDKMIRGLRPSAPILKKELRQSDMRDATHPLINLFLVGIEAAKESGFELLYALPWKLWMPAFSWASDYGFNFEQAEYGCLARKIDADFVVEGKPTDEGGICTCHQIREFGSEYDDLWKAASENLTLSCASIRDSATLQFRNGAHLNIEVREENQLIGFISIKPETGLIADYLARDADSLQSVVRNALWYAATHCEESIKSKRITALNTNPIAPLLADLDFEPVRFKFAFFCFPLNENIDRATIAPENWFLTGGE